MEWYQLIKFLQNECSPEEIMEVENWIKASEENRKLFKQIEKMWKAAESAPDTIKPDYSNAWKNISSKTGISEKSGKTVIMRPVSTLLKLAASIIVIISIGVLLRLMFFSSPSMLTVSTFDGIKKEIRLTDGTIISLNRNSKLVYPEKFKALTREVEIEGEAFFKVAKDSLHPFIVHASGTNTKVLGTSFNIKVVEMKKVLVSVLTGKVAFQPEDNSKKAVLLVKGDKAVYDKQSSEVSKTKESDINFLSWQTGILEFKNSSLDSAAKIISEFYVRKIEVSEESKNLKITVVLNKQKFEDAIKIISITLGLVAEYKGDIIILKRKSE